MNQLLTTSLMMWNTSLVDQTSVTGDGSEMTFASTYLQYDVTHMLWLIVPPVLLVLGCYGNVMTIVVMRVMRASDSTGCLSVYFTALAVSDLVLIWTNILWFWPEMALGAPLFYFHNKACALPYFVSCVSSMTSAWLLVAMACQRMLAVILPHRVNVLCTVRTGKRITATVLTSFCVTNLHIFFHYHVGIVEGGYQSCISSDAYVANIFSFVYLCLNSVFPFLLLLVANSVLVYGAIQSIQMSGQTARKERTHTSSRLARISSMTTTLILTSVAFLVLTMPSCVAWIYFDMVGYFEGKVVDETLSQRLALMDTVCILAWLSNSSINFYIYILSGKRFRQEAKRCLCLRFQRLKRSQL